jgi:ubiquitin C-terminal hydrolase
VALQALWDNSISSVSIKAYKCRTCPVQPTATKENALDSVSDTLVVIIDRTDWGAAKRGDKIVTNVNVDDVLRVRVRNAAEPLQFTLQSCLVHVGPSLDQGHYYCFVRSGDGWIRFDDGAATPLSACAPADMHSATVIYTRQRQLQHLSCLPMLAPVSSSALPARRPQPHRLPPVLTR